MLRKLYNYLFIFKFSLKVNISLEHVLQTIIYLTFRLRIYIFLNIPAPPGNWMVAP